MIVETEKLFGIIEIRNAFDIEKNKNRLLVYVNTPNQDQQYLFVDEIIIGNIKYVSNSG